MKGKQKARTKIYILKAISMLKARHLESIKRDMHQMF